ncbi:PoNe immunity protein domain-containing protein [Pseudomonas sp. Fl4BN1]|uniref:PoNe immunity protein domain-containing protein n=1 Tax=Pseudomonas sp. Fl4BN1 TaxID=2697651 RepID=UPI001378ACED|nr:PoNe immunity protein domain-containing protein [Pseudomonas sp. Fl4BN1]NBF12601.1 DUF1911 domain-containing protein [Pseudomonas sp. Fl4BN1]
MIKDRRQAFLSEARFKNFFSNYRRSVEFFAENSFQADSEEQEKSLRARHFQKLIFKEILIRYTAGNSIDLLIPLLETLVDSYEQLQKQLAHYEQIPNITPLAIDDWLDQYEECVQVFSLCILLHRADLLKRFVALIDPAGYAGDDTLYEDLLSKLLPERSDVDDWYHDVYTPLIQAIYADEPAEASALLQQYCNDWYPAFEQAPWHDSHLQGDEGSYCGYWAFEAAAIAFLYGLDDSGVEHRVYPKDLVAYARNLRPSHPKHVAPVAAGQCCNKAGYWFTPVEPESRRYFEEEDVMPEFDGETIWYWVAQG